MLVCYTNEKLVLEKRVKAAYLLLKIFPIIILLFLAGCATKKTTSEKAHIDPPYKVTDHFEKGVPKKLAGNYYRVKTYKSEFEDDECYSVKLKNNSFSIHSNNQTFDDIDHDNISTLKIDENTYMFETDSDFVKMILMKNGDIKLSDEFSNYRDALNSHELTTYSHKDPGPGFGLNKFSLNQKYYVSETDFTRYYSFDSGLLGSFNLWKVNADGTESLLSNNNMIVQKIGHYVLYGEKDEEEDATYLRKLDDHHLQDEKTGEIFALYQGKKEPKYDAWVQMGVKMKPPVPNSQLTPTAPKAPKKYANTYDDSNYDPEQNDDHLDDYATTAEFEDEH